MFPLSGKDSCSGDSGGPLLHRESADAPWYQVGVVSFGTKLCGVGKAGVYTKVAAFTDWILQTLEP